MDVAKREELDNDSLWLSELQGPFNFENFGISENVHWTNLWKKASNSLENHINELRFLTKNFDKAKFFAMGYTDGKALSHAFGEGTVSEPSKDLLFGVDGAKVKLNPFQLTECKEQANVILMGHAASLAGGNPKLARVLVANAFRLLDESPGLVVAIHFDSNSVLESNFDYLFKRESTKEYASLRGKKTKRRVWEFGARRNEPGFEGYANLFFESPTNNDCLVDAMKERNLFLISRVGLCELLENTGLTTLEREWTSLCVVSTFCQRLPL